MKTLLLTGFRKTGERTGFAGEDINDVLAAVVDEGRDHLAVDNIEASAYKGKTLFREVMDGRNKVDTAIEPGFDGVLIGREHVGQVIWLERAEVGVKDGERKCLWLGGVLMA